MKFYITLYIEITLITPVIREHMHALDPSEISPIVRCAFIWGPWITMLGSCCISAGKLRPNTFWRNIYRPEVFFMLFRRFWPLFRSSDIHHFHMTWRSWTFSCTLWPSWCPHHSAIKDSMFWDERISWNYETSAKNDRFFNILLSLQRNKRLIYWKLNY